MAKKNKLPKISPFGEVLKKKEKEALILWIKIIMDWLTAVSRIYFEGKELIFTRANVENQTPENYLVNLKTKRRILAKLRFHSWKDTLGVSVTAGDSNREDPDVPSFLLPGQTKDFVTKIKQIIALNNK